MEIGVGQSKTKKQWFPVVTNNYISTDLLLGSDVLDQAQLKWNGKKSVMMWGNASYIVHHVKKQRSKVETL